MLVVLVVEVVDIDVVEVVCIDVVAVVVGIVVVVETVVVVVVTICKEMSKLLKNCIIASIIDPNTLDWE